MGTIVLKVKSEKAAQMLADFLQTIEYIEDIELNDNSLEPSEAPTSQKETTIQMKSPLILLESGKIENTLTPKNCVKKHGSEKNNPLRY